MRLRYFRSCAEREAENVCGCISLALNGRAHLRAVWSGGGESAVGIEVRMKAKVCCMSNYRRQECGRFLPSGSENVADVT